MQTDLADFTLWASLLQSTGFRQQNRTNSAEHHGAYTHGGKILEDACKILCVSKRQPCLCMLYYRELSNLETWLIDENTHRQNSTTLWIGPFFGASNFLILGWLTLPCPEHARNMVPFLTKQLIVWTCWSGFDVQKSSSFDITFAKQYPDDPTDTLYIANKKDTSHLGSWKGGAQWRRTCADPGPVPRPFRDRRLYLGRFFEIHHCWLISLLIWRSSKIQMDRMERAQPWMALNHPCEYELEQKMQLPSVLVNCVWQLKLWVFDRFWSVAPGSSHFHLSDREVHGIMFWEISTTLSTAYCLRDTSSTRQQKHNY